MTVVVFKKIACEGGNTVTRDIEGHRGSCIIVVCTADDVDDSVCCNFGTRGEIGVGTGGVVVVNTDGVDRINVAGSTDYC